MPMPPAAGQAPAFTMPAAHPPPGPGGANLYSAKQAMPPGPPAMPSAPRNEIPDLPELPSVPDSTMGGPTGGTSAGGEDVDFDDLTRRFEELKKRK